MNSLKIPCTTDEISDGYHTFGELYNHRCVIFMALMKSMPHRSWISNLHSDKSAIDGWFIVGMDFPQGQVTYHFPNNMWNLVIKTGASVREKAPEWDGHSSDDVVSRLSKWIEEPCGH